MNTAASPRDLIAKAIAEVDGHASSVEPCGDATYEQMADAAVAVLAPEIKSLLEQLQQLGHELAEETDRAEHAEGTVRAYQLDYIPKMSGLLRGMARRAIQHRRYGVAMSQHSLDLSREIDRLAKPNPWFTKPDEFQLEAAERADRERPNIGYAFPTQEWREQQLADRAEVCP